MVAQRVAYPRGAPLDSHPTVLTFPCHLLKLLLSSRVRSGAISPVLFPEHIRATSRDY